MTVHDVAISLDKLMLKKAIAYGIDKRGRTINLISWSMSMFGHDEFMSQI
ncbi:hypothetical protein THOG05_80091 [Vibrio rotiferianus]|nr:hypothetical protein THOG05_80091 [Vibrio rotiferianus]